MNTVIADGSDIFPKRVKESLNEINVLEIVGETKNGFETLENIKGGGKKNKRISDKKNNAYYLSGSILAGAPKRKTNYILNNGVSLLIYFITFLLFYYVTKRTIVLDHNYSLFVVYLTISLIFGALLSNKFIFTIHHELWQILRKLSISLILSLAFLSVALVVFKIPNISRVMLLWALLSGFVLESFYYYIISERLKEILVGANIQIAKTYFLIDILILLFFCYLEIIDKIKPQNLNEKHFVLLILIFISWLFSGAATHKFQPINVARSKLEGLGLHARFYMLIISLVLVSVYFLNINQLYWGYFISSILKYSFVSGLLAFLLFAEKIRSRTDEATTLFLKPYELKDVPLRFFGGANPLQYSFFKTQESESIVKYKLKFEYLKDYKDVFTFLERKLDLKTFDNRQTLIIRSADLYNINVLQPESQQLIVNLHSLNDQNKINNYLCEINKRLVMGGVFVGTIIPNKTRYYRNLKKYPYLIANMVYLFDFVWKRVFPKLPMTKKIYSMFSKGKDRAISLAEGLGRLVFCGFDILDLTEIDNEVYFVVKKIKLPSTEKNLYYSPIFKMRRVGEGGKTIFVYKLRTMHPYSELIQNFVYINNKIQEGGKFKNDFRIPGWGKFFRCVWIDELPMIINWLRRDLKLVGVRPISTHYMSLYSKEHQERRKQFKPGLVPPYYADMPKTIEEIELSEKNYFDAYEKNPLKTDIKYFLMALNNILLMEKRSA